MAIEWRDVRSSTVARVGWDEEADELLVEFSNKTGSSVYAYPNQGRSAYEDLVNNPSPGSYVARWLRNAPSRRIS
jgi:hypothetical protein